MNDKRKVGLREILEIALGVAVIALVAIFFAREFSKNWNTLASTSFELKFSLLLIAFLLIVLSYLVNTEAWRVCINLFAVDRKFSYAESVGMVNTTQLTKYIPGKVWGYAMQMLLVDKKSFSASVVLYVNVFLALTSLLISLIIGGAYIVAASLFIPRYLSIALMAVLLVVYFFFLLYNAKFFAIVVRVFEIVFKKSVKFCEIALRDIARLQLYSLTNLVLFGLAAIFCCMGLGLPVTPRLGIALAAAFVFADAIGFIMIFAPGGIGIRESILYLMLSAHGAEVVALVVPIALRITSMLVDVALGATGFAFLRKYVKREKQ